MSERPYKPVDSDEFEAFMGHFCARCILDQTCPVPALAMLYEPNETKYPADWVSWIEDGHSLSVCKSIVVRQPAQTQENASV